MLPRTDRRTKWLSARRFGDFPNHLHQRLSAVHSSWSLPLPSTPICCRLSCCFDYGEAPRRRGRDRRRPRRVLAGEGDEEKAVYRTLASFFGIKNATKSIDREKIYALLHADIFRLRLMGKESCDIHHIVHEHRERDVRLSFMGKEFCDIHDIVPEHRERDVDNNQDCCAKIVLTDDIMMALSLSRAL
ncbi:unnamed protein product [Polarella glacialis]|uniref:Uncharacterized protein n=1 Tax=Polarella glacialis TaxID=89957 RepID=A0A813GX43_POLGL|nr:unnamed protein product [Polarella glacialis]